MHVGQIRVGDLAYTAGRDLVNLYPQIIVPGVAERLARYGWPSAELRRLAAEADQSEVDLVRAAQTLAELTRVSMVRAADDFDQAYHLAGMDRHHPVARLAVFVQIGVIVTRMYHQFTREANPLNYTHPAADTGSEAMEKAVWAAQAELPHVRERRANDLSERGDE